MEARLRRLGTGQSPDVERIHRAHPHPRNAVGPDAGERQLAAIRRQREVPARRVHVLWRHDLQANDVRRGRRRGQGAHSATPNAATKTAATIHAMIPSRDSNGAYWLGSILQQQPGVGDVMQTLLGVLLQAALEQPPRFRRGAVPIRLLADNRSEGVGVVSPLKGRWPVSISYSTQPNAQMSRALVDRSCRAPARDSCRPPCRGSSPPASSRAS